MMQAIRGRAGSIIIKVLFGLLIISFGFWGVYTRSDYFQGHSPDTVVATVGDQSIRADELQRFLQPTVERLRAQFGSLDAQQIKQFGILESVLSQLVDRSLLDQEAGRLQLEVSDDAIRSAIYENPAFKGPDGRFDRGLFAQMLMMNRLTEDQLIARLRRDLPRADLLQAVVAGATAPPPVVDALYRYRNEKRVADIVAFPVVASPDVGEPSEADLNDFYRKHNEMFQAPEYRAFAVATLSPSDLTPPEIPAEKVRQEYDQHKADFEKPEERDIQQILSPSEEKAKEAEAALAAGKDWKEVATTVAGQDPETIDLGLLNRQEIPHELGDVAFELPLDKPSQPIKTPLGWHILRVVKIEPAATQSFEEAKPKIETDLKRQDAVDRIDKVVNQIEDALAAGEPIADVAGKYGLKLTQVEAADASGTGPDGKPVALPFAATEIVKTAYATNQGENSRVVDTQDGSIFVVHVDKIVPPQIKPLDAVKALATSAWQTEKKREYATKQAEELAAAVKGEVSLAKAAGEKGLTVLAATTVSREAERGQNVPRQLREKLFSAKPGDVVTVTEQTAAYAAQLKEIQPPETVPAEAAAKLAEELGTETRTDMVKEFTDALRKRYPVEIQRDAINRMF